MSASSQARYDAGYWQGAPPEKPKEEKDVLQGSQLDPVAFDLSFYLNPDHHTPAGSVLLLCPKCAEEHLDDWTSELAVIVRYSLYESGDWPNGAVCTNCKQYIKEPDRKVEEYELDDCEEEDAE